jgi:lipopolysaccharide/colanic/teichoic acid biosynthesis glycosyltransferase
MLTKKKINSAEFDEDPPIVEKPQNKFLFIEAPDAPISEYQFYFTRGIRAGSLEEAKKLLVRSGKQDLPELIILDIPLHFLELSAFKKWLKAHFSASIPMIYNESALAFEEIKVLFSQKLVDDVVNLRSNYKILPYKAKFIKKLAGMPYSNPGKPLKRHSRSFANRVFSAVKRSIDLVLASIAILVCLPVFVLIAIAIRCESKGPIIYSADRAGRGFKVFKFLKFRTMVVDADKKIKELAARNLYTAKENTPAFFKLEDDPRVTKVGAFLRNTSLDELPQLFNVLRGDMSIVGNRPLPLYEAASLTTNEWAERFMAPAGITGLWQVKKRGQKNMSAEERLYLDINYARNNNLARDLWIMAKTPSALLQKTNV